MTTRIDAIDRVSVNRSVNAVVDFIFEQKKTKPHYRNYLYGVTTLEELAAIKTDLSKVADANLMELSNNDERLEALRIISRIDI